VNRAVANASGDAKAGHPPRKGVSYWSAGLAGIGAILALILAYNCIAVVKPGHVGVVTMYSTVIPDQTLPEGVHLISPLQSVHQMYVQTQSNKVAADVPSAEGLIIHLETSLVYHLDPSRAAEVYRNIGYDYVDKVVEPILRSVMREVIATYPASSLATGAREEVARKIQDELKSTLAPRGIIVESVLIRDVRLAANTSPVR
jgi:regulator of protease activity HflC (stomatin/prohibitin superfamily)